MAELEQGRVIGSYRVVRTIGQGGMGTVYEVEHVELGVRYALKTFTFDSAHEAAHALKTKFLEEGKVLARLKHPNIAHVFDLAFDEETQMPYFVMDLVTYEDGESYTAEDVAMEDIDEDLVYQWFREIASALDYIHGEGIVHRDIKPANLLLDKDLHPVLTDFGISRIFGEKIKSDVEATRTMVSKTGRGKLVLGTEKYMAPEVVRGEEAVPESDAYSLGVMVLRWLTGFYYGDNPGALGLLSKKKYRWLPVLAQLLVPTPDRRPKTYSDLVKQLKPLAGEKPGQKAPKNGRKRSPLRTLLIVGLTIAVCGVVAAGAYYGWGHVKALTARRDRQLADLQQQIRDRAAADEREKAAEAEAEKRRREAEAKRLAEEQAKKDAERPEEETPPAEEKQQAKSVPSPIDPVIQKSFKLTRADYGLFDGDKPKKNRCVDITQKLSDNIGKGRYSILIGNDLAGVDPADGQGKKARIVFLWNGVEDVVEIKENAAFVLTRNGVKKPKKRREFVVDDAIANVKDYGLIPDKKYEWLAKGDADSPQTKTFYLANKATIDLIAFAPQKFNMRNQPYELKGYHEVTITRPFWVSRTCVTVDQWREFAADDCEDCRELEKELAGRALVYCRRTRRECDGYCKYLSAKYASQLPKGYVFRLPTEAERQLAMDIDATVANYEQPNVKGWGQFVGLGDEVARNRLAAIRNGRREGALGKLYDNGEWPNTCYHVGGLAKPNSLGIHDLFGWPRWLLDIAQNGKRIEFDDLETDPLRWCEDGLYREDRAWGLTSDWEVVRSQRRFKDQYLFHIVLGPDLISEKAWNNARKKLTVAANVPKQKNRLDPKKIPNVVKKPREVTLKRVGGKDWTFCEIPKARFTMTNVNGQERGYHKAEITRPFWMSKFLVTADEWREYATADCDTRADRTVERTFAKYPVSVRNTYARWSAYCDFLTKRYAKLLPAGYVFRLPTEAEWEWALIADDKGDARRVNGELHNSHGPFRTEFEVTLKRAQLPKWLYRDTEGFVGILFVGGRTRPTGFGVVDAVVHGQGHVMVLDTFDTQGCINQWGEEVWHSASAAENIIYDKRECDPIRFAGRCSRFVEDRWMGGERRLKDAGGHVGLAHIVIAPDILAPFKAKEIAPFPAEDFGGVYIGESVTRVDQSSKRDGDWRNSEKQFKRMVSRENVIVARKDAEEDTRGFHTEWEDAPWILLDLGKRRKLAGLAIDAFWWRTKRLSIWVSDDGKHEKLVDCEPLERQRYRIDLSHKNVSGRYLRIGREPGAQKHEPFFLDKIVIYGKAK